MSTSRETPVHIYVSILFIFELSTCIIAAGIIIMVFPTTHFLANGFWSSATTPAEWATWALCIFTLILRIHIVLHIELPALNRQLGALEYQRWSASLDHGSHPAAPVPDRPLKQLYQYHSWYLVTSLALTSTAFLTVGLMIDKPQLYDLAILGCYLLFGLIVRLSTELFWRYPIFHSHKAKFNEWVCGDFRHGQAAIMITGALGWLQVSSWWGLLVRPSRFVHKTADLSVAFEDPMYLPGDFVQSSAYVSTITRVTSKHRRNGIAVM